MCKLLNFTHFLFLLRKKGEKVMDFSAFIKENYDDNERIAKMSINVPENGYRVSMKKSIIPSNFQNVPQKDQLDMISIVLLILN